MNLMCSAVSDTCDLVLEPSLDEDPLGDDCV